MAIEQEKGKWGPHPAIIPSGRGIRDPVAEVLSGQRCAVAMTALNLSAFCFPPLQEGPGWVIQLSLLPPVRLVCRTPRVLARRGGLWFVPGSI